MSLTKLVSPKSLPSTPRVATPTTTPYVMTADAILKAAAKRRGELADEPLPIDERTAAIIRAGALRRGELTDDHEPSTQAERTAALIIEAGRRRRGEI
jgi:hypothetical protein